MSLHTAWYHSSSLTRLGVREAGLSMVETGCGEGYLRVCLTAYKRKGDKPKDQFECTEHGVINTGQPSLSLPGYQSTN